MIAFYQDKDFDTLKLGCTLPNMANICLNKSTDAKFHPLTVADEDLLEELREDVVGGSSVVFTLRAFVDETFIRKSASICQSIAGIEASQLYPCSLCQPIPIGPYTCCDIDSETGSFTLRQNKARSVESTAMSYFQRTRPDCKINRFHTTDRQRKLYTKDCIRLEIKTEG